VEGEKDSDSDLDLVATLQPATGLATLVGEREIPPEQERACAYQRKEKPGRQVPVDLQLQPQQAAAGSRGRAGGRRGPGKKEAGNSVTRSGEGRLWD
jgi:hypothetical protein